MTKNDIAIICKEGAIPTDTITPLVQVRYICLSKLETKVIEPESYRFKFDMTNEVLVCYRCNKVDYIPEDSMGDHFRDENYLYLTDEEGNPLVDIYDFENIMSIGFN